MFLSGIGFGFIQPPNNKTILLSTPISRSGVTGALQFESRIFDQSVGSAFVAIYFHLSTSHGVYFALITSITTIDSSAMSSLIRFIVTKILRLFKRMLLINIKKSLQNPNINVTILYR